MPAFVVVNVEVLYPARYERYKQMAPPSIAAYGGRYLARGGAVEAREGDWQPKRLVILEFPDVARARAWWQSPEYAEAKALRNACAKSDLIILEGL